MDEEARLRTTSIYLVHRLNNLIIIIILFIKNDFYNYTFNIKNRVIPMLPRLLCENLCSLNPGVERLTFSIFFQIYESGDLVD